MEMNQLDSGEDLILYDGVCGLCDHLLAFVAGHDRAQRFRFAPLQSSLGRTILADDGQDPARLDTFFVVINWRASPRLLDRGRGAAYVLSRLDGFRWTRFFRALPAPLLDS